MAGNITGIVRIKIGGILLQSLEGSAELEMGGPVKREPKVGHKFYGVSETFAPSKITYKLAWKIDTPIKLLRSLTNGTLTFASDAGPVYSVGSVATTELIKLTEKGEVEVEQTGDEPQTLVGA